MNNLRKAWQKRHISQNNLYLRNGYYFDRYRFRINKIKINFFILGAQKCATTSLYNFLSKHPDIFMSTPFKEPGYFIFHEHMEVNFIKRGYDIKSLNNLLKTYMSRGYKGERYFGDASVHYSMGLRAKKFNVPQKIFSHNPDAKFIYIIRNPFERIISQYNNYHIQNGSLEQELQRDELLIETSKYYTQLSRFEKFFPKSSIKLILYDDLIKNTNSTLDDIFNFLNLSAVSVSKKFPRSNKTSRKKVIHFSEESYDYLKPIFENEIEQLKRVYNIDVRDKWDLSKDRWTKQKL